MALTTRLVKQRLSNWYALAAVISTGLQMPEFPDHGTQIVLADYDSFIFGDYHYTFLNISSETVIPADQYSQHSKRPVETALSEDNNYSDDDFVVRPNYVKEITIKVASFKIDKSPPKIYID